MLADTFVHVVGVPFGIVASYLMLEEVHARLPQVRGSARFCTHATWHRAARAGRTALHARHLARCASRRNARLARAEASTAARPFSCD